MKAHDLARALLAGPDVEVVVSFDDADDYATKVGLEGERVRFDDDGNEVRVIELQYSRDSDNFARDRETTLQAFMERSGKHAVDPNDPRLQ